MNKHIKLGLHLLSETAKYWFKSSLLNLLPAFSFIAC